MKKIIIALVALVAVVISSLYVEKRLVEQSGDFLVEIEEITKSIEEEEWTDVDSKLNELDERWEEASDKLGIIVEHSLLEKATIALKKSRVYCTFREKQEALAEMKEFEFLVDHLPKGQTIQSKNIF